MGLESPFTSKYITDLVKTNPVGDTDAKSQGDDHIRGIKEVLQNSFPQVSGAVTCTHTELNYLESVTPGVNLANHAPVLDAQKDLELGTGDVNCTDVNCVNSTVSAAFNADTVNAVSALGIGGVAITSTPVELNYLDGSTPGTATASNALVVDATKDIDLDTGDLDCVDVNASGTITGNVTGNVTGNITGTVLTASQPNITAIGTQTSADINGGTIDGVALGTTNTGNTETAGDDSTKLATTAFVQQENDAQLQWTHLATFDAASSTLGENTSIPSTAIGIKIVVSGLSSNGTASYTLSLGRSGPTYDATGNFRLFRLAGGGAGGASGGYFFVSNPVAGSNAFGLIEIWKVDGANTWVSSGQVGDSGDSDLTVVTAQSVLAGVLSAIKITTTDTFDAGSIDVYTYS